MRQEQTLAWLLAPENPSSRYLALTHLLGRSPDDPEVQAAQSAIVSQDPARSILDAEWPEGYWMRPGIGYSPKHKATVWQVIFLAALGAPRMEAIERACTHLLEHSRLPDGRFSEQKTAQGAVPCLNGNLLRAMLQLGIQDPRVDESVAALAEMVARDGFRCRYNAPKPAPARMREGLPCAWGAAKTLGAFAEVPVGQRPSPVRAAIEQGIDLLSGDNLAVGSYPTATRPSPLWKRYGFPLGFTSDLLEVLEVLGALDASPGPAVDEALAVVRSKQDRSGRWVLEYTPRNTWAEFGEVGQPNKWVTFRALHVLSRWEENGRRKGSA
jgi:hypothetical protein